MRGPAVRVLQLEVVDDVVDPAALVLASGPEGPVDPMGALDEAALAAARALLGAPVAAGEVKELPRPGQTPARVFLVGLGDDETTARRAGAAVARSAAGAPTLTVTLELFGPPLTAFVEGLHLAAYRFVGGGHDPASPLRRVEVVTTRDVSPELERAAATAAAVTWAREVTNTRASTKHPAWLAAQAVDLLTPLGVQVEVRDEVWLAEQGFGGVLAVGGGSTTPPRLVEAHWRPAGVTAAPILVVGKGITYDTGGYNLKPGSSMAAMYTDMAGGAAALAAMAIVATARVPVAVSVLVPLADNAVSGSAFRPGDIVVHRGGRTSEVTNTDAEGRVVLADALAYGVETLTPRLVVDIATLTGAMRAALGDRIAGVIGDDDVLVEALIAAGAATDESLWRLPLAEAEYGEEIKSSVADAVNSTGNPPGAITAALFLRPFAGGTPWAHLDIAGTARASADRGRISKGATGFGARLLARWLESSV